MNKLVKLSLTLPFVAFVAACGGGGDPIVDGPGGNTVDLPTLSAATSVQLLELSGAGGVAIDNNASQQSSYTQSLTYVADNDGDIYGVAAESIPTGVSFSAENAANVYVLLGSDEYTLTNGTVDGSIDSSGGDLSVTLSFGTSDIDFNSEQDNPFDINTNMQLTMNSTLSRASECGATNVFCGGTLTVFKDSTSAASATMAATDFVTGVYGTQSDPEIGGVINYVEEGVLTAKGSFVAAQE